MTCFANNQGVERLLTDILMELRKIPRELSPPAPLPLPPPATKDFVAGLPEIFLAITECGAHFQYKKARPGYWDKFVVDQYGDYDYDDSVGDSYVREAFDTAREVWVIHPK